MKLYIIFSFIVLVIILSGCNEERFFICSKDKSQCITVLTYKDTKIRYIMNGKHYIMPDRDYIKININKVDPIGIGDGIWGCWENVNDGWEIVVEKAIIIENKLDTTRFKFRNELPRDQWGVPRETKYRGKHCFIFSYYSKSISPKNGDAIVEKW